MDELMALHSLAAFMGVATEYVDGRHKPVTVGPDTLVKVCAALGAPVTGPADAAEALKVVQTAAGSELVPLVVVAWDGILRPVAVNAGSVTQAELRLEGGERFPLEIAGTELRAPSPLPLGYHRLTVGAGGRTATCTVISAPEQAYRRPDGHRSWGVGTHLAALRSARSRSLGDLRDLEALCTWLGDKGGDLVTVLPLLPTFNTAGDPEPSPYSPVSRLFWSELTLDLEGSHRPTAAPAFLDVTAADAEVRAALAGLPEPDPSTVDEELARYARFRGAQARLGRNWRDWPADARSGTLRPEQVDAGEERFHRIAQAMAGRQLHALRGRLDAKGFRLGLDLAVGVHPDGYDPWSRQAVFGDGMSVGAPPDFGFPSGQDWGFSPVLPAASRREGHAYLAASIGHQMELAGVLRVDHIMAWTRLYWIPHGLRLDQGTYVKYPAEELFAVLALESVRHRCEVVGENLGTVPKDIFEALPRHRIWGMYLAQFQTPADGTLKPPTAADMALVGTHDTPTFAGFVAANDMDERVHFELLAGSAVAKEQQDREEQVRWLADSLGVDVTDVAGFFATLLEWLGRSESPLVVPWLEDLWLEDVRVNLPGTRSSVRPNWQRPMKRLLDDVFTDPVIDGLLRRLARARHPA